jgi:hypothetical protein
MALPAGQAAAMKTIMCYGDSNTWGCIPLTGPQPPRRYGPAQRWPGCCAASSVTATGSSRRA